MAVGRFLQDPMVSVIVAVPKGATHVAKTVSSLRRQTYERLEIILLFISPIGTGWRKHGKGKVKVYRQDKPGISAALRRGHDLALGHLFMWLDAGDTLRPDAVATLVDWFEPMVSMTYADYEILNGSGAVLCSDRLAGSPPWGQFEPEAVLAGDYRMGPAKMYTKELYKAAGGFHPKVPLGEGLLLLSRFAKAGLDIDSARHCTMVLGSIRKSKRPLQDQIKRGELDKDLDAAIEVFRKEETGVPIEWQRRCRARNHSDVQPEGNSAKVSSGSAAKD